MYSCGHLNMDKQRQGGQLEPTNGNFVPIWDVALRTSWKQWMIEKGDKKGSGISVMVVRHDDEDDDDDQLYLL